MEKEGYYIFYFSFVPEEYVSSSDICHFGLSMGNNFGCLFSKSETEVLDKKFTHQFWESVQALSVQGAGNEKMN